MTSIRVRSLVALAILAVAGVVPAAGQPARAPETIVLWPEGVPGAVANAGPEVLEEGRVRNVQNPTLTIYPAPADRRTGTAVIICPGGAYRRLAMDKEGTAVAEWLNGLGVAAFVLKYRLVEYGHPAPLQDVLRAVRLLRADASRWRIDPDRIGVLGFSAGGHLASTAGTLFDAPDGRTGADLDRVSARPDFLVLVYPAIVLDGPYASKTSAANLLGPSPSAELLARLSTHAQVTHQTPPTFLAHGGTDESVPPENSVLFYQALRRAGVPAEMHLYQTGPHGSGLEPNHGPMSDWPKRCAEWMAARGLLAPATPLPRRWVMPPAPDGVTIEKDVTYLSPDRAEKLDLYYPATRAAGARSPAVVIIHGGGWTGGDKASAREFNIGTTLALAGYVAASVNYSLEDGKRWPTGLLDCKNAVRFLRARAERYQVDADRIGVIGGSAGGHLALMVAYTAGLEALEPRAPYPGVSSAVLAVVDMYGPSNLLTRQVTDEAGKPTGKIRLDSRLLATKGEEDAEGWRNASPIAHVRKDNPPTLILHGTADTTVDRDQSIELARALERAGAEHQLVLIPGIGHTFTLETWEGKPLPADLRPVVVGFFDKHLK